MSESEIVTPESELVILGHKEILGVYAGLSWEDALRVASERHDPVVDLESLKPQCTDLEGDGKGGKRLAPDLALYRGLKVPPDHFLLHKIVSSRVGPLAGLLAQNW